MKNEGGWTGDVVIRTQKEITDSEKIMKNEGPGM